MRGVLSCIYAGIFAAMFCAVFVPCLLVVTDVRLWRSFIKPWSAAAVTAAVLILTYAYAYTAARATVGTRSIEQIQPYSASAKHFLAAPQMNRLYGSTAITDPMVANENESVSWRAGGAARARWPDPQYVVSG